MVVAASVAFETTGVIDLSDMSSLREVAAEAVAAGRQVAVLVLVYASMGAVLKGS